MKKYQVTYTIEIPLNDKAKELKTCIEEIEAASPDAAFHTIHEANKAKNCFVNKIEDITHLR